MAEPIAAYPMSLLIDFPDRKLNRLTTFFRPFMAIPIIIILALVIGIGYRWGGDGGWSYRYAAAGVVVLPTILMLVFRQKYPKWWFD